MKTSFLNKKQLIFFEIVSIAVVLIFLFNSPIEKTDINKKLLKNGDLILRKGKSPESFVVYTADKSADFSHIGMVVSEANKLFVVHAVPHKNKVLKKETIEQFLSKKNASKYAIYRANFSEKELQNVTQNVIEFYNNGVAFDNQYNLKTDDKMYCTELILKAFSKAHLNLNIKPTLFNYILGKHSIILPSAFTKQPFNKILINPLN